MRQLNIRDDGVEVELAHAASRALRLSVTASGSCPWAAGGGRRTAQCRASCARRYRIFRNSNPAEAPRKRVGGHNPAEFMSQSIRHRLSHFGRSGGNATVTERRAQRFVDLTGIGTDGSGRRPIDLQLLRSARSRFLEAYEPDLRHLLREAHSLKCFSASRPRGSTPEGKSWRGMKTILITGVTAARRGRHAKNSHPAGWEVVGTGRRGDRLRRLSGGARRCPSCR